MGALFCNPMQCRNLRPHNQTSFVGIIITLISLCLTAPIENLPMLAIGLPFTNLKTSVKMAHQLSNAPSSLYFRKHTIEGTSWQQLNQDPTIFAAKLDPIPLNAPSLDQNTQTLPNRPHWRSPSLCSKEGGAIKQYFYQELQGPTINENNYLLKNQYQ